MRPDQPAQKDAARAAEQLEATDADTYLAKASSRAS